MTALFSYAISIEMKISHDKDYGYRVPYKKENELTL